MAQIVRHCADCDADRPFEQPHDEPGGCPDTPDGECAEWSCMACGAALLIGVSWLAADQAEAVRAGPAELHRRVA